MTTTVEVERSGTFEAIGYQDFKIELGTSVVQVAPTSEILTVAQESTQPAQRVRITIDGTRRFEGVTRSAGKIRQDGSKELVVEHDGVGLMDESVDVSLSSPTDQEVLRAALDNSDRGGSYTLDFVPSATTLSNDYNVSGRQVKRIFRDIMDRTGYVWRIDPTGETVHVETRGGRGLWQSFDAQTDNIGVVSFDDGSAKSVINDVEVIGTGDEAVSATATDSTSISTYGRRTGDSPYKISYVTTQTEAQNVANNILQPDPLPAAEILVGANAGTVEAPQINQTVDLTDATKDISATGLTITKQTVEQGRATLKVGGDAGGSIERVNRNTKSRGDVTEPGSVYNSDRIADGAIQESELADLSVSLQKVQDGAIDTVKITDDAIETPKILTGAVTADEIKAGTITALEIDTLDLDTGELSVTAPSIDSGIAFELSSLAGGSDFASMDATGADETWIGRGGEFDAAVIKQPFPLNDGSGTVGLLNNFYGDGYFVNITGRTKIIPESDNTANVGTSSNSWAEMYAYSYIDASTGSAINDGGDVLSGLADGHGPPDHCEKCDGDGETIGYAINEMARSAWDAIRAQQREIENQQDRIDDLEERLSAIEVQL